MVTQQALLLHTLAGSYSRFGRPLEEQTAVEERVLFISQRSECGLLIIWTSTIGVKYEGGPAETRQSEFMDRGVFLLHITYSTVKAKQAINDACRVLEFTPFIWVSASLKMIQEIPNAHSKVCLLHKAQKEGQGADQYSADFEMAAGEP